MPLKIEVSQILVRHADLADPRGATRTREQACLRALEALHTLQGGADWDETVRNYSDSRASQLGRVARDDLAPGFSETAFSLDVNQLSYVVESSRGYHIILRTR
jgi:parvulin-like peptidyl-prolyl isomerase